MTRSSPPCQALTKKGKRCQAAATAGGLCFFHANPNKASELGRIGGRRKRPTVPENAEPLPALDSMMAVRDTVNRLITDVYAGNLHPKIAAGLAPLLQLQIRALNAVEIEQRLSKLERLVAREQKSKGDGSKYRPSVGGSEPVEAPTDSRESQKEPGPPFIAAAEQVVTPTTKNGLGNNADPLASIADPTTYATKVERQDSGEITGGPRIQDAAARAMQAELDEQKQGKNRVVVRTLDTAARDLEQDKSELPNADAEAPAPSNLAAQQPTMKTAATRDNEAERLLPTGAQQPPSENAETGAMTRATKSDREIRHELMKQAQEAWMTGKLGWALPKQK